MTHITAQQLIDEVLDPHTFQSWDETPHYGTISDDYQAAIDRAKTKSGVDEAVITGEGMISGTRVAFVLSEFTFLGGSIGAATARRIITAIHRATAEQLPLLISPSSGGTRIKKAPPHSPSWYPSPPPSTGTKTPTCPSSYTCATPPPAGSWHPGDPPGTSPSPTRRPPRFPGAARRRTHHRKNHPHRRPTRRAPGATRRHRRCYFPQTTTGGRPKTRRGASRPRQPQ